MEFHEVANVFPLMSGEEYEELKRDIVANGLREPIWTHQGKIIDGRNRYKACTETGTKPKFQEWDGQGSLVAFVMSLNLHRRHLTASQKAAVASTIKPIFEAEAKERQGANSNFAHVKELIPEHAKGQSRDQAAAIVGVNPRYVTDYETITEQAPDLAAPIRDGIINIPTAKTLAVVPQEERAEILAINNEAEIKAAVVEIKKAHVAHNTGNNEWYTPDAYIRCATAVLGQIDLDPASSDIANERVKAAKFFSQEDDGLSHNWSGNVWMNPPYESGLIGKFCDKLVAEYQSGNVTGAIVLVNNATETGWFRTLIGEAVAVCFPHGRVRFLDPVGNLGAPLQGQAVLYFGDNDDLFNKTFSELGWCANVCKNA
jgi:phage N-6-adenine-methyltransferase